MTRPMPILVALALLAVLWIPSRLGAEVPRVAFASPAEGEPAFGDVEVRLRIESSEPVTSVSLFVDGMPSGERSAPPFVFRVSLGDANLSHRFTADVVTASGARASASLVTPAIQVDEVVDLALQQVYVTVTDRGGKRVTNLDQGRFRLFDNRRPQKIVTFAGGEIPFSAVILIDGSDSMQGVQMEAARAGARSFLAGMKELDEAKVIVFSTRLLASSEFDGPKETLSQLVEDVRPEGGTAVHDFLFFSLRLLEKRQGRRVVVLLSDGWDIHSVLRMEQVAGAARQSQAQIFWLQLKERGTRRLQLVNSWRGPSVNKKQRELLHDVIRESGGRILRVFQPADMEGAFKEVLAELREQYALGYYPDQRFDDGRWRPLEIDVEGPFKVKAREGYLDLP